VHVSGVTLLPAKDKHMTEFNNRSVYHIVSGLATSDGAGVQLTRYIGSPDVEDLDPFLLLDFFESDNPNDYIAGFPSHPHRGFETVTYLLAGKVRHKDSTGREGILEAGGIQWMTAGRGIIHSEMPEQEHGRLAGFQLWVNLPAKRKMCQPAYHEYSATEIPVEVRNDSTTVRVITGSTDRKTCGPVTGIDTDPLYFDVTLSPKSDFREALPPNHAAFIFVIEGTVRLLSSKTNDSIDAKQLAILGKGDHVAVTVDGSGARFLLVAARPLNEPIARYGPFVMNTRSEIDQAIHDFNSGRFSN